MNWEAIGALGELIGAIVVIATLFYLSYQVREGIRVAKSQIREQRSAASQQLNYQWAEYAEVMTKARQGIELNDVEQTQLMMMQRATVRTYEASFFHFNNGLMDESEWIGVRNNIQGMLEAKHWREGWHQMETNFSPQFRQLVNDLEKQIEQIR